MPNYCENIVTFRHEDPTMLNRAKAALMRERLFQEFLPAPPELVDEGWWDWACENWGTIWDVRVREWTAGRYKCGILEEGEKFFSCAFLTAWSPPIAAYDALRKLGFEIEAMYLEIGRVFSGTYRFGRHFEHDGDLLPEILRAFGYVRDDEYGYVCEGATCQQTQLSEVEHSVDADVI